MAGPGLSEALPALGRLPAGVRNLRQRRTDMWNPTALRRINRNDVETTPGKTTFT